MPDWLTQDAMEVLGYGVSVTSYIQETMEKLEKQGDLPGLLRVTRLTISSRVEVNGRIEYMTYPVRCDHAIYDQLSNAIIRVITRETDELKLKQYIDLRKCDVKSDEEIRSLEQKLGESAEIRLRTYSFRDDAEIANSNAREHFCKLANDSYHAGCEIAVVQERLQELNSQKEKPTNPLTADGVLSRPDPRFKRGPEPAPKLAKEKLVRK